MTLSPQLSSVSTALTELTKRIAALAESLSGSERDDVAGALFEVERSLKTAGRRLDKVVSDLR
jgi:DNA/RNA-binding domain of Phe-tRNA-synthetase-like protein